MSAFQLTTIVGVPLAVLLISVVLLAFTRPDRDNVNGIYAVYLALASVFTLYLGLLALAALGEAVSQHLVVGDSPASDLLPNQGSLRTYFSLVAGGGASTIAAFATLTALMGIAFAYHARRRVELATSATESPTISQVDRAYRGSVCFAMLSLVAIGAMVAGSAGYDFFAEPVASSDRLRDLAMGSFVSYAGLIVVAGIVFRVNVWAIRGNDDDINRVPVVEIDEGGTGA